MELWPSQFSVYFCTLLIRFVSLGVRCKGKDCSSWSLLFSLVPITLVYEWARSLHLFRKSFWLTLQIDADASLLLLAAFCYPWKSDAHSQGHGRQPWKGIIGQSLLYTGKVSADSRGSGSKRGKKRWLSSGLNHSNTLPMSIDISSTGQPWLWVPDFQRQ